MLGMSQGALADLSNVSRQTIVDFETGGRKPGRNNLSAIRGALETAGVRFTANGVELDARADA